MKSERTEIQIKREPRKRYPAEKRRAQLIRTAAGLFSRLGFEGTTTKAIAAAARISEGIIFKHFSTKEELYTEILDYKARESGIEKWEDQLQEMVEREDDWALVRSIVKRILESERQDPEFHRLLFQAALKGHPLTTIMAKRMLSFHQFLFDYIRKRQKKGALRKCDPVLAVHAIVSMPSWHGLSRRLFDINSPNLPEDEIAESFTRLILEGLRVSNTGSNMKGSKGRQAHSGP